MHCRFWDRNGSRQYTTLSEVYWALVTTQVSNADWHTQFVASYDRTGLADSTCEDSTSPEYRCLDLHCSQTLVFSCFLIGFAF